MYILKQIFNSHFSLLLQLSFGNAIFQNHETKIDGKSGKAGNSKKVSNRILPKPVSTKHYLYKIFPNIK